MTGTLKICYGDEQPDDFLHAQDVLPIIHTRFQGIEPAPIHIEDNFMKRCMLRLEKKPIMR